MYAYLTHKARKGSRAMYRRGGASRVSGEQQEQTALHSMQLARCTYVHRRASTRAFHSPTYYATLSLSRSLSNTMQLATATCCIKSIPLELFACFLPNFDYPLATIYYLSFRLPYFSFFKSSLVFSVHFISLYGKVALTTIFSRKS